MRRDLLRTLRALAAEPDAQLEHLEAFRHAAREVREGVRDMVLLDEGLARQGAIRSQTAARVRELDALFDRMIAAGEEMFTERALREASEWAEVRRLARLALRSET